MHPRKVNRAHLAHFTDLPNVGPAMAGDFAQLGYATPLELTGEDPYALYLALCRATGTRQDPCVLDTFMSVTSFLAGDEPKPWWHYTAERKQRYGAALAATHR
jgi:hypothetical protein